MGKLINLRDAKRRRSSRAQKVDRPLSFPKIISGRIDGVVRPRLEWRQ
jgi:hypothetical protein